MNRLRPLDPIRSIKTKISIVIVASVGVTAFMSQLGLTLGWPIWVRPVVAGALALMMAQFLARGLTPPLRRMAVLATNMANGDHTERINITRRDEVGQLATAFDRMVDELAETDRLQKEFVANASHELRTPVAALRSTLENLVDGVDQPERSTLEHMLLQAENLSVLVNQLLDLSRLDADTELTSQPQPVDIGDLLHQVAAEVMLTDPTVQITVRTPIRLLVDAQPHRLRQVFMNIIGNACRFSTSGEEVTIVATQDSGRVRVAVRDRGPGIPTQERERIFERFWQADGVSRLSGGGAGLGLAISKQIIDQHHGKIEVSANHPSGACFVVDIPRRRLETKPTELVASLA